MAEVERYVNTAADPGGNGTTPALSGGNHAYQSLQSWSIAEQTNLVIAGDNHIVRVATTGGPSDTTPAGIAGAWVTGSGNDILVQGTDFPADGIFDPTAYVLATSSSGPVVTALTISEDYVTVRNLQITSTTTSTGGGGAISIASLNPSSLVVVDGCIVGGSSDGTGVHYGIACGSFAGTIAVINTTIQGFVRGAQNTQGAVNITFGTTLSFYNNVFYGNYWGIRRQFTGTVTVKNCAVGNNSDDFNGTMTIDNCVSDDGDGTNSLGPLDGDWLKEFVDADNGDFTPVEGGNILVAGLNDPGSGLFSTDILGDSYVIDAWARGAYAGIGGGGGGGDGVGALMFSSDF